MLNGTVPVAPRALSPSLEPEGGAGKGRGGACARTFLCIGSPKESALSLWGSYMKAVSDRVLPQIINTGKPTTPERGLPYVDRREPRIE